MDRSRHLFRGWRARNPKRGAQFLRYYLQLLFPGQWVLQQLWHDPLSPYPDGASASEGPGKILTSRLRLALAVSDITVVDQLIASFRAVLAARFVLETSVLQQLSTGITLAGAMTGAEVQAFTWDPIVGSG